MDVDEAEAMSGEVFEGMVLISINYKGQDFRLTVDLQTANTLLNDQQLAESYIEKVYPAILWSESNDHSNDEDKEDTTQSTLAAATRPLCHPQPHQQPTGLICAANDLTQVWFSKGRPTPADKEATALFLELRQKLDHKFRDRKTLKIQLWNEIAKEMKQAGFDICANSKEGPGGKLKQKFINMEAKYLQHIKHMNSTGKEKKDPPPFFDELHSIIGGKDKSHPKFLQDSDSFEAGEPGPSSSGSSDFAVREEDDEPLPSLKTGSSKEAITSRFSKEKKSARPKSGSEIMLDELKRQFELDREDRRKSQQLMEVQNTQRSEMLNLFREFIDNQKSK